MTDRYFTREEAAARLKCSLRQIDRFRTAGRLKSLKLGMRGIRFLASDVESLIG